jgi:hypothetical protein
LLVDIPISVASMIKGAIPSGMASVFAWLLMQAPAILRVSPTHHVAIGLHE